MKVFNWLFGKKDPPKEPGATPAEAPKSWGSASLASDRPKKPAFVVGTEPAGDATPEVVRIGAIGGRIVNVTQKCIEYIDMAGQEQFVDLDECAKNWARRHDDHRQKFFPLPGATEQGITAWNARCVGQRAATDNSPWVEFMNKRKTRFEFGTYEAIYGELLEPLMRAGWHTFDTT